MLVPLLRQFAELGGTLLAIARQMSYRSRADEIVRRTRGPMVLDIGCTGGPGALAKLGDPHWLHGRLRERFPDVHGLDQYLEGIEAMRSAGMSNLHVADAQDFEFPQRFDTVVAGEVIEHLDNPGAFLRCAARHLKPGGRVIVTTPYAFALHHVLYATMKFPKTCPNAEHTLWLCPRTFRELVARTPLRVDELILVEDYLKTGSLSYDLFGKAVRVMPRRLRGNRMLAVLSPV
jgi:2-polyprenyl-3-methyl-5-hydroxy-6-metoxy-1,4-benzoquinol methylase